MSTTWASHITDSLLKWNGNKLYLTILVLTLNVNKTKYVIFGTRHTLSQKLDYNLSIQGTKLECLDDIKYLGVYLDWELNFDKHTSYVHAKAVKKLGVLKKTRPLMDKDTSVLLYKSLVLLLLDYCDTVYECTSKANLTKLQQIQTSACRTMLLADKFASSKEMQKSLCLLPLEKRRLYH